MKKFILIILALVLVLGACWLFLPARISLGSSELYTPQEVEEAADLVVQRIKSWERCRLYSVEYAGDERCLKELDYCQGLQEDCAECIVFEVVYHSPLWDSGAWNPNQVYFWTFYLGRPEGGDWDFITWGEA